MENLFYLHDYTILGDHWPRRRLYFPRVIYAVDSDGWNRFWSSLGIEWQWYQALGGSKRKMKAISIMLALVVDAENRKLLQEIEVVYEDGTVRTFNIEARKSMRVDLETLYKEPVPTG